MNDVLLQALRESVGAAHVLTEGDLSAYELDWRRRFHGRALAVVRPASTAEVAAVLRACAAHGASVVPQGGNTGLVGGGVPDASGTQVLLSLTRMQRVRGIDAANLTMTVEAGCVLQAVQQAASDAGLMFPLSLAAEGSCTIGGNLATNAGGTQVLRYGNARELCLGLEVVTADGQVWDGLSGLRKDNTGYDLRDLFIGSEGTLGIITAATLKLQPQPAAVGTALAAAATLQQCVALLGAGAGAAGRGADRLRSHEPLLAGPGGQALPRPAPAAGGCAVDGAAGAVGQRRRSPGAHALRSAAGSRDGSRLHRRCRGRREPDAVSGAVAPARIDPAGARPRKGRTSSTTSRCRCRRSRPSSPAPMRRWRRPSPACGW